MIRDLLIIVFYVDVRGLPATILEKRLEFWEKKYSMVFSKDVLKRYEIKTLFIPSMGETKVELLYPKVTENTSEEKKLLTMVNEIKLKEGDVSEVRKEDKIKLNGEKPIPPPSRIIYETGWDFQWLKKIKNKLKKTKWTLKKHS